MSLRTGKKLQKDEMDNRIARFKAAQATGIHLTHPEGMPTTYYDRKTGTSQLRKVMTAKQEIENANRADVNDSRI